MNREACLSEWSKALSKSVDGFAAWIPINFMLEYSRRPSKGSVSLSQHNNIATLPVLDWPTELLIHSSIIAIIIERNPYPIFSGVEGGTGRAVLEEARLIRFGADGDGYVGSGESGKGAICLSNLNRSDFSTGCGERSNPRFIEEVLSGSGYVAPAKLCSGFNGYASRPPFSTSFSLARSSRLLYGAYGAGGFQKGTRGLFTTPPLPEDAVFVFEAEDLVRLVTTATLWVIKGRMVGRHAAIIAQQDSTVLQTLMPKLS